MDRVPESSPDTWDFPRESRGSAAELRVWLAECHLATLAFCTLVPVVGYLNNSKRKAGTRTRRIRFICLVMAALLARNS